METAYKNLKIFLGLSIISITLSATAEENKKEATAPQSTAKAQSFFQKDRWAAKYSNYMNGPAFSASEGASINHVASIKYKFRDTLSAGIALRADTLLPKDSEMKQELADPYLTFSYRIATIGKKTTITGDLWQYLPMSKASQEKQLLGVISPRITLATTRKKIEFANILVPKIFLKRGNSTEARVFSVGNYAALSYAASKRIGIDLGLYPELSFESGGKTKFNKLAAYPGFTAKFSDAVSLSPYVEVFLAEPTAQTTSVGAILSAKIL